jgi:hypothetical protein
METTEPFAFFNGGKMEHIFKMVRINNNKNAYCEDFFSNEAARTALEQGRRYWKIDGACGMIRLCGDNGQLLEAYERQDTRGRPPGRDDGLLVPLPTGANASAYGGEQGDEEEEATMNRPRHTYYMRKVVVTEKDGKKQRKLKQAMLDILTQNRDALVEAIRTHGSSEGWLSVEWVGTKFQKTPGVEVPVALCLHCHQRVQEDAELPRTYQQVKDLLARTAVEGIVIEHAGRFWKIRSNLMDPHGCLFEKDRTKVPPPLELFYATQKE